MQISFNWLKKYVKLPDSVSALEVAEKLKLSTVEVEGIIQPGALLEKVLVGKVLSVEKHPNADKLKVCQVDVGTETVTIVCGGSNVVAGMLTVVAKVGAKVKWHGEGEPVELKPTAIRGIESFGMICGADEVGLTAQFPKKEEKEIVDLGLANPPLPRPSGELRPGTPLAEALGMTDAIFEIDNKSLSNRPDLWGHYGLAREVAVLFNREVKPYKTKKIKEHEDYKVTVSIDDQKMCSRYLAVAVTGVSVKESPAWLQQALMAAGVRPINNVVDVTNYVMLDIGQPMHAFDARKLSSSTNIDIRVKKANAGEVFKTLDDVERKLVEGAALIAAPEKVVALAGVMGGEDSAIAPDTTTIVLEAANFDAALIRRTSTGLGLRTDSSVRFEKSLDPTLCLTALERAVELITELCPRARVGSAVAEAGSVRLFKGPIEMPANFITSKLGVEIPPKTVTKILERLGFVVTEKEGVLCIAVPSWRARDTRLSEDIVEEVARVYGYDKISSSLPTFPITPPPANTLRSLERVVSDCLARDFGFTEVYSYSFVSAAAIEKIGEKLSGYLELDNPLSKERPYVRRHLLLNLLETAEKNRHEYPEIKIFEIGKVFHQEMPGLRSTPNGAELLPRQDTIFTALFMSEKNNEPWNEVRAVAERLANALGGKWRFRAPSDSLPFAHPGRAAELTVNGELVGHVFEFHPRIAAEFKLEQRVGFMTLNLSRLQELPLTDSHSAFTVLALYPAVKRDIAFVVSSEVAYEVVNEVLLHVDPLLTQAELFDVYTGDKLKAGHKSMAFHLTYQHPDRTLTAKEIDKIQADVEHMLQSTFGAELRT